MKSKQIPCVQLDLFESAPVDYDQIVTDKANALLELLNMDSKPKDKYQIEYYFQVENYIILIACNRLKNIVCNVVDIYGNIPKDFSVNWRNYAHIQQEIELENNLNIKSHA